MSLHPSNNGMLNSSTTSQNQIKRLLLLVLILSLVPFLILTVFSHPAYDDYTGIGVPLLLFSLFSLNNTGTAISDLVSLRAYHYDIAVRERYAQFEQCARAGHIDNCPALTISDLPTTITNPYFETEFEGEKQFWKLRTAVASPK